MPSKTASVEVSMRRCGVVLGAWGLVAACHPAAPTSSESASVKPASIEEAPPATTPAPSASPSSEEPGEGGAAEGLPAASLPEPSLLEPSASSPPPPAPAAETFTVTPNIKPLARSQFLSARDVAVFNQVCQLEEGKRAAGCTCCPLSTWCVDDSRFKPVASIEHVFHGAFTAPGRKEVFAAGASLECGNLSAWGATWFLRHDGQAWQPVRGESSTHEVVHGTTWKRADGTRGVVAHDVIGKSAYEAIVWMTFDEDGKATREELLTWRNSDCMRRMPGYYAAAVDYVGANALDHDKDGRRDLVIALDVRRRFADEAFQKECSRWYDDTTKPGPVGRMKAQRVAVPLLFDGTSFTPEAKAFGQFSKLVAEVDKNGKPTP